MLKETYSSKNSEYLTNNESWHVEDSPWKADQILRMIEKNGFNPKHIVEIGCGAGVILQQLQMKLKDQDILFEGYDISPDAHELSKGLANDKLKFFQEDLLEHNEKHFDLLLMIDVFEHVENYLDFIRKSAKLARYKIYHIPLDIHVSSVLRGRILDARKSVGHINYFSKDLALATIEDTGQEVVDYFFTEGAMSLPNQSLRTRLGNIPRRILGMFSKEFSAKLLGGYSLLVLAK